MIPVRLIGLVLHLAEKEVEVEMVLVMVMVIEQESETVPGECRTEPAQIHVSYRGEGKGESTKQREGMGCIRKDLPLSGPVRPASNGE